uniref:Uncharacterized protein n=1 Tax=Panagrolaimus superbus TaxID=310955 RepID=A0A914XTR9_9BILA
MNNNIEKNNDAIKLAPVENLLTIKSGSLHSICARLDAAKVDFPNNESFADRSVETPKNEIPNVRPIAPPRIRKRPHEQISQDDAATETITIPFPVNHENQYVNGQGNETIRNNQNLRALMRLPSTTC